MKTLIETQYFAPIQVYALLNKQKDGVILEQCEHYQKRSFRNKCRIASANGIQTLTVPLESGKNAQQPIRDVKIAYGERWQAQHWQSIRSAYGKSPYFEYYADYFEPLFGRKHQFLFDLNLEILSLTFKLLKINQTIEFTADYRAVYVPESGISDYRNYLTRVNSTFENRKYPQVFEDRHGFIAGLSIIDLLFCMGPDSKLYF